jgi:DNA-binding transcriptional ArsR family regulator
MKMMYMKHTVIAPVGDHMDALFVGLREFPTEKVILITPKDKLIEAENTKKDLDRFKIPAEIVKIQDISGPIGVWEEMFRIVSEITKNGTDSDHILINVATGDRNTRCAATSAAFVNGVKAFAVDENQAAFLPVLKFNYYKMITDKKMRLLKFLMEENCCSSLEQLSKKAGMSLPLISYHINGTPRSQGLKDMGLVDTEEIGGRISLKLTRLGRVLVQGYIK